MIKNWNFAVASIGHLISRLSWQTYLSLAALTGVASIGLHALGGQIGRQIGAGFFLAGSSLLGGVLIGFLFAIPKSETGNGKSSAPTDANNTTSKYSLNTNLEDISDWLSKMIIGVGLVQLTSVPEYIKRASEYWTSAGNSGFTQPYTSAMIIFFSLLGFLVGYLWTRLVLIGDFIRQDPRNVNLQKIETKIENLGIQASLTSGSSVNQQIVRPQEIKVASDVANILISSSVSLEDLRVKISILSAKYESIRAAMPSGLERTKEMEAIASQMRGYALAANELLPEYISSKSAGDRLVAIAFLQIKPNKDYFAWLSDRFPDETHFLQYQAAIALRNSASTLLSATTEERDSFLDLLKSACDRATSSAESHGLDPAEFASVRLLKEAVSILKPPPALNMPPQSAPTDPG